MFRLSIFIVCITAVISSVLGHGVGYAQTAPNSQNWMTFRGDAQSTGIAKGHAGNFKSLKLEWKFKLAGGGFESAASIVTNKDQSTVYIAGVTTSVEGVLYAFDLKNGAQRWAYETQDGFLTTPAYADDRLFLGDMGGRFHCVGIDGKKQWEFSTDIETNSNANFFRDNVLFGSQNATLYSLNQETGKQVWAFEASEQIQSSITIADGHAFLAGCDSQLHVIDVQTGKQAGSVDIESPTIATPAVVGDVAYFGTEKGDFFAVDWRKEKVLWKHASELGATQIRSSAALVDGHVVFGGRNRKLYSLHPQTGKENWSLTLKNRIDSSPVIMGDRIIAASTDGRLYVVDLESGHKIWEKQFNGSFSGSPAVSGDRIIIATDDGVVYCLSTKN